MRYTVLCLGKEFIVDAKTNYEAKQFAAESYNKTYKTNYPLKYLRDNSRLRCHEDKRMKIKEFDIEAPSILKMDQAKRELEEVDMLDKAGLLEVEDEQKSGPALWAKIFQKA